MALSTSIVKQIKISPFFSVIFIATVIFFVKSQDSVDSQTSTNPEDVLFVSESEKDHVEDSEFYNSESDDLQYKEKDFYSCSVHDVNGELVSLEKYRGKVVLVVNVASACGFTDGHYKSLVRMKNVLSYTDQFEVLAFPCNQFGAQEPGTNAEIQKWVQEKYHANFPLFSKINVLDDNVPEAWQYLIDKTGKAPNWNFWKYLVNDHGHVIDAWGPRVPVEDLFHLIRQHVDSVSPVPQTATQGSSQTVFDHAEL